MKSISAPASCILITGATGFLGGALAAELLSTGLGLPLLFLIRAEDLSHALQRLRDSLARFEVAPQVLDQVTAAQVVVGDFTQPDAFISDPRMAQVTRVVHCAALTSFGANRRAFTTNVDGALSFIHHLRQVAKIERFLHVSTAMICGDAPPKQVQEDDYPRHGVKHLVSYTHSKADAERLLRLTLPNFPLVIVRPSIIVGHSRLGCAPSVSIYWAFRMSNALGMIISPGESQIDVVPVDYAAAALLRLLLKPTLSYKTYHISAGQESSCTWDELAAAFGEAAPEPGAAGPVLTKFRTSTFAEIELRKPEFDAIFGPCRKDFMMKAIKLYGAFSGLDTVFDTKRLRAEGVGPSPRFVDYLSICQQTSCHNTVAEQMMIDFA